MITTCTVILLEPQNCVDSFYIIIAMFVYILNICAEKKNIFEYDISSSWRGKEFDVSNLKKDVIKIPFVKINYISILFINWVLQKKITQIEFVKFVKFRLKYAQWSHWLK